MKKSFILKQDCMTKRSTKMALGGIIGIGALFLTLAVVPAAAAATVKHARPAKISVARTHINKANLGGVFGNITAISGNTLTVQGKINSSTAYTVDATNARITINGATSTLSALAVSDQISVRGTPNGTNQITAKTIAKGNMRGFGTPGARGFGR